MINTEAIVDDLRRFMRDRIQARKDDIVREAMQELRERQIADIEDSVASQVEAAVMSSIAESSSGVENGSTG